MSTEVHQGILSVRWFAAVGGSGTDETALLQRALDHATSDAIFVHRGVYTVTGLEMTVAKRLILDRGATIILADLSDADVILVNVAGVTIEGEGTINGNRANQTSGHGINVNSVNGVKINGITVTECAESGIYGRDTSRLWVTGATVTNTNMSGIFLQAVTVGGDLVDNRVVNCYVDRSDDADNDEKCIAVQRDNGTRNFRHTLIEGNHCRKHATPTGSNPICIELFASELLGGISYSRVVGNSTEGGEMGISVASRNQHCTVVGNTIANAHGIGIEVADSEFIVVNGNTIDGGGTTTTGISLDGSNLDSRSCSIFGNTIENTTSRGIYCFNGAPGSTISGNTINVAAGIGIRIQSSTDIRLNGNAYQGNGTASYGLQLDNCSRIRLVNNQFRGSVTLPVDAFLGASSISDLYFDPSNEFQGATVSPIVVTETGVGVASVVYLDDLPLTPTTLSASVNDYNPGWQRRWRLSSNASRTITGIARGYDGRRITIMNVGSFEIIITDQDVASAAANRIDTGTGGLVSLLPGDCMEVVYDGTSLLYRMVGRN